MWSAPKSASNNWFTDFTWMFDSPYRSVEISRNAVGDRLEPKGGLQTYFEPRSASLKDTSSLSSIGRY